MPDVIVRRDSPSYIITRIVYAVAWVIEVLLGLRFILRLIGANPAAGFTSFIYNATLPLLNPFINVARSVRLSNGGVIEWSTLIAMIIYGLVAWALVRLVYMAGPGRTVERI